MPGLRGAFGNFCCHIWGRQCSWCLAGGDWTCCWGPTMDGTAPAPMKNYWPQDVSSAKAKKSCSRAMLRGPLVFLKWTWKAELLLSGIPFPSPGEPTHSLSQDRIDFCGAPEWSVPGCCLHAYSCQEYSPSKCACRKRAIVTWHLSLFSRNLPPWPGANRRFQQELAIWALGLSPGFYLEILHAPRFLG